MKLYKIHDHGCDVCKAMSKFDVAVMEGIPEIAFEEISLDQVTAPHNTDRPITMRQLYRCIEEKALNPDYTLDLPVYVCLDKQGAYVNHLQGAYEVANFRDGVKSMLVQTD